MTLNIKAIGSFRSDKENIELKKELKTKYNLDTRRQDAFIHLALIGAQRLKEKIIIKSNTELYITSDIGNIDILQKTHDYVIEKKQFIRPFDFINMLGNTASYYVATSLNIKDKNIYQISDNFTFINSLISIYASLNSTNKNAILGAVDLVSQPDIINKRLLDVCDDVKLVSSSSYQFLSTNDEGSIAELKFSTSSFMYDEIKDFIDSNTKSNIILSKRCKKFYLNKNISFCETILSSLINENIELKKDFIYIDCYDEKYKKIILTNKLN